MLAQAELECEATAKANEERRLRLVAHRDEAQRERNKLTEDMLIEQERRKGRKQQ